MHSKVFIIAEAGVNHNGSLENALQLVDAAVDAGADAVKFQTFHADSLVSMYAPKAEYQKRLTDSAESQRDMLKRLELNYEAYRRLAVRCAERGIIFLSTPFDLESIDFLESLGMGIFKVPSGEINNLPYLRKIGGKGKPVILSTGMATLDEVGEALGILRKAGSHDITVLHCNTEYPSPFEDVNLKAMRTISEAFQVQVGYSDHTNGIEVSVAAVALGAIVIEKHFTLSREWPGPDQQASLEPGELKTMVRMIRNIEKAISGHGRKEPSASEKKNISVARRSIVASCAIHAGERFTAANLAVKRPGTGLSPMQWDRVLGRCAARDFQPDEQIEL